MPRAILDPAMLSRLCQSLNSASVSRGTAVSKMVFLICLSPPASEPSPLTLTDLHCSSYIEALGSQKAPVSPTSCLSLSQATWGQNRESGTWVPGLAHASLLGRQQNPANTHSASVWQGVFSSLDGHLCRLIFQILNQPCIPAVTFTWS